MALHQGSRPMSLGTGSPVSRALGKSCMRSCHRGSSSPSAPNGKGPTVRFLHGASPMRPPRLKSPRPTSPHLVFTGTSGSHRESEGGGGNFALDEVLLPMQFAGGRRPTQGEMITVPFEIPGQAVMFSLFFRASRRLPARIEGGLAEADCRTAQPNACPSARFLNHGDLALIIPILATCGTDRA